jgi:hypothetical protein
MIIAVTKSPLGESLLSTGFMLSPARRLKATGTSLASRWSLKCRALPVEGALKFSAKEI